MGRKRSKSNTPHKKLNVAEGATIMERFEGTIRANNGNLSRNQILQFLSVENATVIGLITMNRFGQKEGGEYLKFFERFLDLYGEDTELGRMIFENWGDLPLVLEIGAAQMESESFPYNQKLALTPQQGEWKESFVEHVFGYNTCRTLSFAIYNPEDDSSAASQVLEFPDDISEDDMGDAKEAAGDLFGYALQFGGWLILRLHGIGFDGKDIINGFIFSNGKVRGLPADELREGHELHLDGSSQADPTADYRAPFWSARQNQKRGPAKLIEFP